MKRLLLCLMVMVPVVTVYGASTRYFVSEVQVSDYWRATQTVLIQPDDEFFSDGDEGEEEQEDFTSDKDELFISVEDDHTAPVDIDDELLIEGQGEDDHTAIVDIEDENNRAGQSAGVIITPDEIEELLIEEQEDVDEQAEPVGEGAVEQEELLIDERDEIEDQEEFE